MTSKEWKKVKIENICLKVCSGGTPKSTVAEYYNGDIPWLNTKEINFNRIYNTEKKITNTGFKNSSAKWIDINSIIVAMYGATAGKVAITKIPITTNQACCNLTIDDKKADYNFVYYALVQNYKVLLSMANGGAQQNLNAQQIKDFEIELPPLETQEKIARILSSLDDKIELNNKINQNLEQQAQAIFKSWFVDFEPFGGKMPEDWSLKTLSDISNITSGGDKPDIVSNIETEECKIPIYSNGIDNNGLYGYTTEPKILQESVTVSARGTIGFTCLRLHPYVPIVRLISLIPRTDIVSAKYLYFSLLNKHITGTGTTQQQLTVPYFKTTPIIVPTFDIVNQFTEIVNSFYKIIEKNICENKRLIQLRDTLLPKLMSGEIDVDKVEV